ncbi:hypothetical protein B0H13DRAFT_2273557 [Mycena leptocephala]|nr:hypothetical protein B0H13DRAFT_2273557 [Mycena leptocephala]
MPTNATRPTNTPPDPGTTPDTSSTPVNDPGRVTPVANTLEDLFTLIETWKKSGKVKTGDRQKAVDLVDKCRAKGVRNVSGNGLCPPSSDAASACHRASEAAVAAFAEKALAAIQAKLDSTLAPRDPSDAQLHRDIPSQAPPAARPRAAQPPSELLVTISMAKADRKSPNRQRSPAELKAQIEAAMGKLTAPGLREGKVHSVRKLSNGNILVQANTEEQATMLLTHGQEWISHFEPNACVHHKAHMLVADYVPTSFDPRADGAKTAIYHDNQGTIPSPAAIRDVRWLHPQKDASVKKKASSLVIVLDDAAAAEGLILCSLSLVGTSCPVSYFTPPPLQCYNCQALGHMAKACSQKDPKCAKCAGPHATRECECPNTPRCANARECTHIKV